MIFCKQALDFHRPSNILCRASRRPSHWSSSTVLKILDADPDPEGPNLTDSTDPDPEHFLTGYFKYKKKPPDLQKIGLRIGESENG